MTRPHRPGNSFPRRYYRPRQVGKIGRGFLIIMFGLFCLGFGAMIAAVIIGAVTR